MVNMCPVCGYGMEDPPQDYNICPSCGTEFGLHDANSSIATLRAAWLRGGARWWSPVDPQPSNWDPYLQLDNLTVGQSVWVNVFGSQFQQRPVPNVFAQLIAGTEGQRSGTGGMQRAVSGARSQKAA
jgi:hypothetical protein